MSKFTQRNASLFVQFEDGGIAYYLGDCADLDSIPSPQGGREYAYCWNRDRNGHVAVARKISTPDMITFSITELVDAAASWLEQRGKCPMNIYVLYSQCGRAGVFANWERAAIVKHAEVTNDTLSNIANHVDDNEVTHEVEFSAPPDRIDIRFPAAARLPTTETGAGTVVYSPPGYLCGSDCGKQLEEGTNWYIGTDPAAAATAKLLVSTDGGVTWATTAADPFGVSFNINGVVVFDESPGVRRILCARATDAATPCTLAYSDDNGATWTTVVAGSTNGEFVPNPKSLIALDREHIWAGTSIGNVYFSEDGGATFTVTAAVGAFGAIDVLALSAVDENLVFGVAEADKICFSEDGGITWATFPATGSGADLNALKAFSRYRILVGGADEPLYMTMDGGTSWIAINLPGMTAGGTVKDMHFVNDLVGAVTYVNGAAAGLYAMTIDGGRTWRSVTVPTNTGLASVWMSSPNKAIATGAAVSGTAMIVGVNG